MTTTALFLLLSYQREDTLGLQFYSATVIEAVNSSTIRVRDNNDLNKIFTVHLTKNERKILKTIRMPISCLRKALPSGTRISFTVDAIDKNGSFNTRGITVIVAVSLGGSRGRVTQSGKMLLTKILKSYSQRGN